MGDQVHYLVKQAQKELISLCFLLLFGLWVSFLVGPVVLIGTRDTQSIRQHTGQVPFQAQRLERTIFCPWPDFEALMQDGPILLGMRIYQDFYAYESGAGPGVVAIPWFRPIRGSDPPS